ILKEVLRKSGTGSRAAPRSHPMGKQQQAIHEVLGGPIEQEELQRIADRCSQTERTADDAERELLEWKKMKFMQERIGCEFTGLVISVTKFGLFVELQDLFIEGLVPIHSL